MSQEGSKPPFNIKNWNRFVREGMKAWTDESASNVVADFRKMSKQFGREYLEYLDLAWQSCEGVSIEDFCRWNGDVPVDWFQKRLGA